MKRHILHLLLLGAFAGANAVGQITCTATQTKQPLVCEFPISTGSLANTSALGSGSQNVSGNPALSVATGLNTAAATQVSQLPLAAASAGSVITYKNGPNGPLPVVINDLGPILVDRAQTVGQHRFFLGGTASQFVFTEIDGNSLSNLQWSYVRPAYDSSGKLLSNTYSTEKVTLNFRINQYVVDATYGVTKKTDLSLIVPVSRVSLSSATTNINNYVVDPNNNNALSLQFTSPDASASGTASGVGDIIVNVKSKVQEWERDAIAISGSMRMPSGDALNFLGSGAWGINGALLYSHAGKFAPHMKIAYQWNTTSKLNNPTNSFRGNLRLPGGLQYDLGVDWAVKRKITVVGDILGSQFQNVTKLETQSLNIANLAGKVQFTTVPVTAAYTVSSVSAGAKWGPAKGLVLSANLLVQINNVGLHSRPAPMLGISYRF